MTVTHTTSVFAESPVGPVGDGSAVERWLNEGGRDVQPERERRSPEPARLAGKAAVSARALGEAGSAFACFAGVDDFAATAGFVAEGVIEGEGPLFVG